MGKKDSKRGGQVRQVRPELNPRAHESDERKAEQLRNMELRRLKNRVDRQREKMESYEHPDMKKRPKINPLFDLKGSARPAREHYKDPNYFDDIPNTNLLVDFAGRIYEHEEGKILLQYMHEYGVSLYNNFQKSREAESVFKEMLSLDKEDHYRAKDTLLRCYLDCAKGEKVRELLDAHPDENNCLFAYSRALIEHISCLLEEPGSSQDIRDQKLDEGMRILYSWSSINSFLIIIAYVANPYALWCLVYSQEFAETIDLLDEIPSPPPTGSVEDAFMFFASMLG